MKTNYTLEQKINLIPNLPEVRLGTVNGAEIAKERIALAKKQYAETLAAIEESFELDCWSVVERNWTPEEIKEAAK